MRKRLLLIRRVFQAGRVSPLRGRSPSRHTLGPLDKRHSLGFYLRVSHPRVPPPILRYVRHIFLVSFLLISPFTFGVSSFYMKKAEGWHFYEEHDKKETRTPHEEEGDAPKNLTPKEILEKQRERLEEALLVAILSPTEAHLKAYMLRQRALLDQSEAFAAAFKRALYLNPELDEAREKPTSHKGRHIYLDEERKKIKKALQDLSKTHGLFLFVKPDCPYCHAFLPQVQSFAGENGFSLLVINGGEGPLSPDLMKGISHVARDNGMTKRFNITYFPTLLAVDPKAKEVIPLAYGMISLSEIEERLMLLRKNKKGERS